MEKPSREDLEEWFKVFDADGSGKIDPQEVKTVVAEFYKWQSKQVGDDQIEADAAAIMKVADTSGDGKIDKAEFFKFFEA